MTSFVHSTSSAQVNAYILTGSEFGIVQEGALLYSSSLRSRSHQL